MNVLRKNEQRSEVTKQSSQGLDKSSTPATLPELAYAQLEEWICTVQLEPGEVLSEIDIANRLNIGRTPVREALQKLASEGLVVILPRRGVLVSEINVGRQLELIEVRRVLEKFMVESAASRAGQAERDQLFALADDIEKAEQGNNAEQFLDLEQQFNRVLTEACRNRFASKTMTLLNGQSRQFWNYYYKDVLDLKKCAAIYAELARFIAKGNTQEASRMCDSLIDYIDEFTHATLKQRGPGSY